MTEVTPGQKSRSRKCDVALTTEAFDRLASFYRNWLGLEPAQVWPEDQGRADRALVLDMGKAKLEVFNEKQAQTIDQVEVGRRISGRMRFALQVPDLDAAMKRLLAYGATCRPRSGHHSMGR
jgi:hypothetical protein